MKSINEMRVIKKTPVTVFPVYETLAKRYNVREVLSLANMIHKHQERSTESSAAAFSFNVLLKHLNYYIGFKMKKAENYNRYREAQLSVSKITIESLLNTNNALHNLVNALWRVYHSNNLRLSHSFFRLIHAITEQKVKFNELLPVAGVLQNFVHINNILEEQIEQFQTILPVTDIIRREMVMRNIFSVLPNSSREIDVNAKSEFQRFAVYEKIPEIFTKQKYFETMLFVRGGITPVLQNIYESIESNSLFYNSSIYQSARTLYRLTNSLWRVYNSQNLELSRSFTRLINTITERNMEIRHKKTVTGLFSTTDSLHNLIYALRRAFSGNNLQLRQSLISLISDIHEAGRTQSNTSFNLTERTQRNTSLNLTQQTQSRASINLTGRQNFNNYFLLNQRNETDGEQYFSGIHNRSDYKYCLMLYRLFLPSNERAGGVSLYHQTSESLPQSENLSLNNTEKLIEGKLNEIKAEANKINITDAFIKKISDRIKEEQRDEIRFEKLKRGMF